MNKVNQLFQDARNAHWQQYYDDYCLEHFGGAQPEGRQHDEAVQYANDRMEEEEDDQ
jgi:hypothetical protein